MFIDANPLTVLPGQKLGANFCPGSSLLSETVLKHLAPRSQELVTLDFGHWTLDVRLLSCRDYLK
jgi:hypothetical protein